MVSENRSDRDEVLLDDTYDPYAAVARGTYIFSNDRINYDFDIPHSSLEEKITSDSLEGVLDGLSSFAPKKILFLSSYDQRLFRDYFQQVASRVDAFREDVLASLDAGHRSLLESYVLHGSLPVSASVESESSLVTSPDEAGDVWSFIRAADVVLYAKQLSEDFYRGLSLAHRYHQSSLPSLLYKRALEEECCSVRQVYHGEEEVVPSFFIHPFG